MIQIKARYGRDKYKIVSTGHAGTSQTCTAVSAIIQALAGWAQNNGESIALEKGKATISFTKCEGAAAVMDLTVIGLLQIQRAMPDDIHVDIECAEKTAWTSNVRRKPLETCSRSSKTASCRHGGHKTPRKSRPHGSRTKTPRQEGDL